MPYGLDRGQFSSSYSPCAGLLFRGRPGQLTSGSLYKGTIAANATNSYTFTATIGDSLILRVGALTSQGYFYPWLRVLDPNGIVVGSQDPGSSSAAEVALTAANSGTVNALVLLCDGSYGGFTGTGTYELSYIDVPGAIVVTPGEQGGPLTNGSVNAGTIGVGELDSWTFTATNGDSVILRVGELTTSDYFRPWLRVYGPNGVLVQSTDPVSSSVAEVVFTAANTGAFTVVVSDGTYEGIDDVGTYQLSYVQVPGTFVISPGATRQPADQWHRQPRARSPAMFTVGALETWTFPQRPMDEQRRSLRGQGELTSSRLFPSVAAGLRAGWRFGGDQSEDPGSSRVAEVVLTAPPTPPALLPLWCPTGLTEGIDEVAPGTYQLSYVQVPGTMCTISSRSNKAVPLVNGTANPGTITVGALEAWTFTATNGDSVILRAGELTTSDYFRPWLRVYGPDGVLVQSEDPGSSRVAEVVFTATNTGAFTVVVSDGTYEGLDDAGTYQLSYVQVPGTIEISPGQQGGPLVNGTVTPGTITVGALETWTFTATNGDSVLLRAGELTTSDYFPSVAADLRAEWRSGAIQGSSKQRRHGGRVYGNQHRHFYHCGV